MIKTLTHIDSNNNPVMVNVSEKNVSTRSAHATGYIQVPREIMDLFIDGDIKTKKGSVFHTAIIAGTMAVKKTHELIPFCHPLLIEGCKFDILAKHEDLKIEINCTVTVSGKTGVEMEAITGVSIAALTIYDMCKAVSVDMSISDIKLIKKTGGKSDYTAGTKL